MEQEMHQPPNATKQQQQLDIDCPLQANNYYLKSPHQPNNQSCLEGMSQPSQTSNYPEHPRKKYYRCDLPNAICQHSITIRRIQHVDYSNLHPPEAHMKLCPIDTNPSRQMPILLILDNEQPHMPLFVRGEQLSDVLSQEECRRAEYEKKKWFYIHPIQGSFKPKENYCLVCEKTYPCAYSDHVKDYEHVYKYYMNPLTEMITDMAINMGRQNAIEGQLKKREILRKLKETYQKTLLRTQIFESLRSINKKENTNAEIVSYKRRIKIGKEGKDNRRIVSAQDGDIEVLVDGFSESSEGLKLKIRQIQAELDNNNRRLQDNNSEDIEQYEYEYEQQKLQEELQSFSSPELNINDIKRDNNPQDYIITENKILISSRFPTNNPEKHGYDEKDNRQQKLPALSVSAQRNNSYRLSLPEQTYAIDMIPTEQDEEIQFGTAIPDMQLNSSSNKEQVSEDEELEFPKYNKDNSKDQIKQKQIDNFHQKQLKINRSKAIFEQKLVDNSLNQLNRKTIKNSPKDLRNNRFETKNIKSINIHNNQNIQNQHNLSVNQNYQGYLPIKQHSPGPIPSKRKNSHILTSQKKLCNFSTMADDSQHQSLMKLSGQDHRNIYRSLNFNQKNSKEKSDCKRNQKEIGMVTLEDEIGIENVNIYHKDPFSSKTKSNGFILCNPQNKSEILSQEPVTAPRITVENGKKSGKDTSSNHKEKTSSLVTTGQIIEEPQKKKQTDKIQGQLDQLTQQARTTGCIKFNFDDLSEIIARNPDKKFSHFHVNRKDDGKNKMDSQEYVINLNSPRINENIEQSRGICKKGFKNKKRTYDQFANSNNRILKENNNSNIEEVNNSNAEAEEDYFDDEINISKRFKLFGILTTEFKSYWNHSWQFLVSHMPQIFANKKTTKSSQKEQR